MTLSALESHHTENMPAPEVTFLLFALGVLGLSEGDLHLIDVIAVFGDATVLLGQIVHRQALQSTLLTAS